MSDIIVRYECDGCGYMTGNPAELNKVTIAVWRGSITTMGNGIYTENQFRLFCDKCLKERETQL